MTGALTSLGKAPRQVKPSLPNALLGGVAFRTERTPSPRRHSLHVGHQKRARWPPYAPVCSPYVVVRASRPPPSFPLILGHLAPPLPPNLRTPQTETKIRRRKPRVPDPPPGSSPLSDFRSTNGTAVFPRPA